MKLSLCSSATTCPSCGSKRLERSCRTYYRRIQHERRRANPAAIVLWAFHQIPSSEEGVTSRRVIGFLKKHYKVADDPGRTGRAIGKILRDAVEFGLLEKIGNKYFLPNEI